MGLQRPGGGNVRPSPAHALGLGPSRPGSKVDPSHLPLHVGGNVQQQHVPHISPHMVQWPQYNVGMMRDPARGALAGR